jgi:proteasome alpha subunit
MTMPYYASPEQLMRDRSEYARKGISRGRSVAVVTYADGVLFIAENPSSTLHKVSELYDRIGFAAVGRYSEFESLRVAGIRLADVRGYSYNRRDVTGRVIANAYAQTLGRGLHRADEALRGRALRRRGGRRPRERPALPADLRRLDRRRARLRRHGRQARGRHRHLREHFSTGMGLSDALSGRRPRLSAVSPGHGRLRQRRHGRLTAGQLEVALLDRRRPKRAFRRVVGAALRTLLGDESRRPDARERPPPAPTRPSVPEPAPRPAWATPPTPTRRVASRRSPRTDGRRPVATYRVNKDGVAKARELIDAGKYDDTTEWSDAAPSADDENAEIDKHGYDGFGAWHLAVDPDASEETRGVTVPLRRLCQGQPAALIHAKQRAAQNDHDEIEKARRPPAAALDEKRDA